MIELLNDDISIPDDRLRLIFICCHPAVAADSRALLTLKLVCGLTVPELAQAFLLSESAVAQRLVRAKHKIAKRWQRRPEYMRGETSGQRGDIRRMPAISPRSS